MMGINGWEFLVLALLALLIVGPKRLPEVATQAASMLKKLGAFLRDTKDSLTEEFGDELADLKDLDPRQYDPRRIVREAMSERRPEPPAAPRAPDEPPPFDPEAT